MDENWYVFRLSAGPILRQIRAIYDQITHPFPHAPDDFRRAVHEDEASITSGGWLGRREEDTRPFRKSGTFWAGSLLHASSGAAGGRLQGFLVGPRPPAPVLSAEGLRIFRMHAHDKSGVGKGESRRAGDMPLTTTSSFSVAAGTMNPPGHMQKVDSPVPNGGGNG